MLSPVALDLRPLQLAVLLLELGMILLKKSIYCGELVRIRHNVNYDDLNYKVL